MCSRASVDHFRCPYARARRPPIPASDGADRPARGAWRRGGCWPHDGEIAGLRRRDFRFSESGWDDDGAQAIGAIDDDDAGPPVERSELWGHRQQIGNSAALSVNLTALTCFAALTRARGGCAEQGDRLEPPGRRCRFWSTSSFRFSGLLFADSGRRWSSADRGNR